MAKLILGHTTHNSIKIWVRGEDRWPVAFVDVLDTAGRKKGRTKSLLLGAEDFYTGVVTWTGLSPEQNYTVKVAFGKTEEDLAGERIRRSYTEGKFRTFPNSNQSECFCFLLGSCNLHSAGPFKNPDKAWLRISQVASVNDAKFMIHCGDQIYADIPFSPAADPDHYREKYLDAWDDCRPARRLLTELPHYMILDDHEIINNFDRDMAGSRDYESLMRAAMKVYFEFQHKHNPDTPASPWQYHYTFNHGTANFFVMDTRYRRETSTGSMIDDNQLAALKNWLLLNRERPSFIVTSVPFVGQIRKPKADKWCDVEFSGQRDEIIDFISVNNLRKITFLTGDMHTSYHAKMQLTKGDKVLDIHELMSSPINQLTPDTDLDEKYISPVAGETQYEGVSWKSTITKSSFFGSHSNIMAIEVAGREVKYRIYRTRRSGGPAKRGAYQI